MLDKTDADVMYITVFDVYIRMYIQCLIRTYISMYIQCSQSQVYVHAVFSVRSMYSV